ncbi:hypothetical protein C8R47DRAFT_985569, partial [Mycena vitilis]
TYDLRAALGEQATAYCTKVARGAASQSFRDAVLEDTPTTWERLPDQLAAALHYMTSGARQKQDRDIPLQGLFPQSLVAMQNAFLEGHSLITQHRRIKIIRHPSYVCNGEDVEGTSTSPSEEVTYQLTAMRVYHWVPDRTKGRFVLQQKVPAETLDLPGLFFDMPSYYEADSPGDGLASPRDREFFTALEHPKTNIAWVLTPALVSHRPFTGHARDLGSDHLSLYNQICTPQTGVLHYTRLWCEGFTFGDGHEGSRQVSLSEIVSFANVLAASCGLANSEEHTRPSHDGCYIRRRTPIDSTVRHILIKSHAEAVKDCAAYTKRHSVDNSAVFGPYVARWGKSGISFRTKSEADFFTRARNYKHAARKEYVNNYPHNIAFHPN